jgi:hypothetical protein
LVREIAGVARVKATGLISNTHMLDETTAETINAGAEMAIETGRRLDLPVVAAAVQDTLNINGDLPCPALVLRRIVRPPFEAQQHTRTTGPLFVLN